MPQFRNTTILVTALLTACGGRGTTESSPLYAATNLATGLRPIPDSVYTQQLDVGRDGVSAPVTVRWTAGEDGSRCRRISSIRIDRLGGNNEIAIRDVTHAPVECAMHFDSEDTTRFESARLSLSYDGRVGVKQHQFRGAVATITGTGALTTTR